MDPYVGEIRLFAGTYAPRNWAFCQGQLLPISGNEALFSLIGTTYGGDGQTTIGIPDLRGLIVCGTGQGNGSTNTYAQGQTFGQVTAPVSEAQMPAHTHAVQASSQAADATAPANKLFAAATSPPVTPPATPASYTLYANGSASNISKRNLKGTAVAKVGSGQPHPNLMPTLAVSYIICLNGFFPNFD